MNVMAVFAHPDDEIGCIGTLARHAARGDKVMLVWTTLGELASQFGDRSHEDVTRTRREHGAWVAEQIGASYRFFDMGDSRMTGSRDEALQLARLYAEFQPNAVITWSDDHPHPDHRVSAKIAYDAVTLARIPKILNEGLAEPLQAWRDPVRIYQYHADASPYPEVFVDITDSIDVAERVMAYYQRFYGWAFTPEAYRQARAQAGTMSGVKYAERFNLKAAHPRAVTHLG
ncbi:PIG-L deacetylase family protein [Deinococcus aquiradiocola]|uniref:GlcNAc-PI de-N-acetylase n=1 Tax=Deinococcus aquiradiocola TaxID=393059 RepID=A0A917UKG7_9DEIO|nr:PIG-L deacetylase family protein [Deinococcus aquiradiocola]GGJ63911.1 GlcNAc-PI de-N-acetylase [Deinococcus aquiradiocola]